MGKSGIYGGDAGNAPAAGWGAYERGRETHADMLARKRREYEERVRSSIMESKSYSDANTRNWNEKQQQSALEASIKQESEAETWAKWLALNRIDPNAPKTYTSEMVDKLRTDYNQWKARGMPMEEYLSPTQRAQGGYGGGGTTTEGESSANWQNAKDQEDFKEYQQLLAESKGYYGVGQQKQGRFGELQAKYGGGGYQGAYDEAKIANEQRYGDILKGYGERLKGLYTDLEGMGKQEATNINRQWTSQGAALQQQNVGRGLYGSTVQPTMTAMIERGRGEALGGLTERLKRLSLQYSGQYLGDTLNFMERRQDTYPNYAQGLRMAQMAGRSGQTLPYGWR